MLILFLKESDLMRPLKEKVSITLDGDVVEEVKRLAEEDDRSFSQYINRVLRKHVKDKTTYKDKSN